MWCSNHMCIFGAHDDGDRQTVSTFLHSLKGPLGQSIIYFPLSKYFASAKYVF